MLVIVTAAVFASMYAPWSGRRVRDVGSSPGDHPMLAVPMVTAVIVVVMPGRQGDDGRTVPIMVMAIMCANMDDSSRMRDMSRPVAVRIVVERAVPQPAACQHDRNRQHRQHKAKSHSHRIVSQ